MSLSSCHKEESLPQVWIDGRAVRAENACVSVFDRGFLYGDSVFETLRTYGNQPFALEAHLERLQKSAQQVFIELPCSLDTLASEVNQAVLAAGFDETYVRVMVTRGRGALGLDPGLAETPLRVLLLTRLQPPPRNDYDEGISAVTYRAGRPGDATSAAGAKIGNYLVAVLSHRAARARGAKEALIVGADGRIVEGATSNVFWLCGSSLWTVPIEAGILPGITRRHLLEIAAECGLTTHFQCPTVDELWGADAVFVSSSIREILSLVRIDGREVGDGKVSPKVKLLHNAFRRARGVAELFAGP